MKLWKRKMKSLLLTVAWVAANLHGIADDTALTPLPKPATGGDWERDEPAHSTHSQSYWSNASPPLTGAPSAGYVQMYRRLGIEI